MTREKVEYWFGIIGLMVYLAFVAYGILFQYKISQSDVAFTVMTTKVRYATGKDSGYTYQYLVNGALYKGKTSSSDCRFIRSGERYVVRFRIDYPHMSSARCDLPVPVGVESPPNGWDGLPKGF